MTNIQNKKVLELMQQQGVLSQKSPTPNLIEGESGSFESILRQQVPGSTIEKFGVKLSKHAQKRIEERNIQFEDNDWKMIKSALNQAASKGSKESLFIMDEAVLVMSVPNHTVITAVDKEQMKNNVFTNIDSTVILQKDTSLEEQQRSDLIGDLNRGPLNDLVSSQINKQKINQGKIKI